MAANCCDFQKIGSEDFKDLKYIMNDHDIFEIFELLLENVL